MTRGVWKGPFVHPSLLKKVDKLKNQTGRKPIKTWSRNSTVIPEFVGHSFLIHNGKTFIAITISEKQIIGVIHFSESYYQSSLITIFSFNNF